MTYWRQYDPLVLVVKYPLTCSCLLARYHSDIHVVKQNTISTGCFILKTDLIICYSCVIYFLYNMIFFVQLYAALLKTEANFFGLLEAYSSWSYQRPASGMQRHCGAANWITTRMTRMTATRLWRSQNTWVAHVPGVILLLLTTELAGWNFGLIFVHLEEGETFSISHYSRWTPTFEKRICQAATDLLLSDSCVISAREIFLVILSAFFHQRASLSLKCQLIVGCCFQTTWGSCWCWLLKLVTIW